tara:strand:+ start:608 stop:721 length:114 start_codon:yes stop_codon:yes gene_type:complete
MQPCADENVIQGRARRGFSPRDFFPQKDFSATLEKSF